jgi:predicted nucleic acid-binding protein
MTRSLVIDASFAFRLILPSPRQTHFRALMTQWKQDGYGMCAPMLWVYEITSALCKAVHFGQLRPDEGTRALVLAQGLDVQLIPPDDTQARLAFDWTMRLNRATAYDSFYLALTETLGCELWTTDKHLCNAVDRPWVHWVSGG